MTVFDCSIVELPKFEDRAGNLTPVYGSINIPFDVKRVFYSYDIPGGEARGAHAHKECHQLLVAASGSFEVVLDDGVNKRTLLLNRPFLDCIFLRVFGLWNKGFLLGLFVWYWLLMFTKKKIILGSMRSLLNIKLREKNYGSKGLGIFEGIC